MLGCLARNLVGGKRRLVEFHPGVAIALEEALDDEEEVGPDCLRTEVTAPHAAKQRCREEQAHSRKDQEPCDVVNLLRPDLEAKEIEPATGKVGKCGLVGRAGTAIPADPWNDVIEAEGHEEQQPLYGPDASENQLRINLLPFRIENLRFIALRRTRRQ